LKKISFSQVNFKNVFVTEFLISKYVSTMMSFFFAVPLGTLSSRNRHRIRSNTLRRTFRKEETDARMQNAMQPAKMQTNLVASERDDAWEAENGPSETLLDFAASKPSPLKSDTSSSSLRDCGGSVFFRTGKATVDPQHRNSSGRSQRRGTTNPNVRRDELNDVQDGKKGFVDFVCRRPSISESHGVKKPRALDPKQFAWRHVPTDDDAFEQRKQRDSQFLSLQRNVRSMASVRTGGAGGAFRPKGLQIPIEMQQQMHLPSLSPATNLSSERPLFSRTERTRDQSTDSVNSGRSGESQRMRHELGSAETSQIARKCNWLLDDV
jgi:hypothetical protein